MFVIINMLSGQKSALFYLEASHGQDYISGGSFQPPHNGHSDPAGGKGAGALPPVSAPKQRGAAGEKQRNLDPEKVAAAALPAPTVVSAAAAGTGRR